MKKILINNEYETFKTLISTPVNDILHGNITHFT